MGWFGFGYSTAKAGVLVYFRGHRPVSRAEGPPPETGDPWPFNGEFVRWASDSNLYDIRWFECVNHVWVSTSVPSWYNGSDR